MESEAHCDQYTLDHSATGWDPFKLSDCRTLRSIMCLALCVSFKYYKKIFYKKNQLYEEKIKILIKITKQILYFIFLVGVSQDDKDMMNRDFIITIHSSMMIFTDEIDTQMMPGYNYLLADCVIQLCLDKGKSEKV